MSKIKKPKSFIDSTAEKNLVELTLGSRKPKNQAEKKLLQQINDIAARGGVVDIPADVG